MPRIPKTIQMTSLLVLAAIMLGGCANTRLQQERDALYIQNQELQDELDRTRAALDAAEAARQRALAEAQRLSNELAARPTVVDTVPVDSATGFDNIAGVETFQTAGAITVRVPGDVLFSSGKVDLKSSAKNTLNQVIRVIKSDYPGNTIRIEGYTDTDPIRKSKWKDNLELSLQRAAAVHRYLQSQGIDEDRMYAAGFGATKPQATKAKSRRVEIAVVLQN